MPRTAAQIHLTGEEEATLRQWSRLGTTEQRMVERARVILLSQEGVTVEKIAERLQTRPARVSKWRQRFAKDRLAGLSDAPRRASRTSILRKLRSGFWQRSIRRHRRALRNGTACC